ncbi:unnamed protein product [Rotaria magnacalcarata]|uniref:Uncharacterized protein n=1 Tax=Rotaria magnacalcarata TaxID=392030 RepID=A0A816EWT2_9BILA|nr:unnamed protein product [Rotaria magnacalcarata]
MTSCHIRNLCSRRTTTTAATAPKFGPRTTALEIVQGLNMRLDGKAVLITVATSVLDIETARALATTNAHLTIMALDMARGAQNVEDLKRTTGNKKIEVMELDFTSLKSVRNFVTRFRQRNIPINILICNAGIMACPYSKTVDGFESQFGVNHLAHFHLANLILPELRAGKPARVVVWAAYAQRKSANILFAKQFNKSYEKYGIQANLQRHTPVEELRAMGFLKENGTIVDVCKTIEQGASTNVYAALAPELNKHGGEYLEDCTISQGLNVGEGYWGMGAHILDTNNAERLWKLSEQLVASK